MYAIALGVKGREGEAPTNGRIIIRIAWWLWEVFLPKGRVV